MELAISYRGQQYYRDLPMTGYYNHTLPPNSHYWDCGYDDFTRAHMASRSYHAGGANVGFADGSVKFIKNSINITTWNALGTRGWRSDLHQRVLEGRPTADQSKGTDIAVPSS